jgi:signal transduction histidine kinase/DNA-binding response OmpR family regulator
LFIVNDDINNRLCQQGKTVNLMQNTPETILLLSESPYSYNWKRKTFTPIHINHLKDAIVGQLLPICVKETFSYLHDSKCIYRIDHNDNTLHVLYHCKQDTMIHSASADEKGIIWIGGNYGLGSFSPNDGSYTHISNSLINEAMSVASDQHGRLWIGNNERLLSWMTTQKRFILYGVPDGVAPNEYLPKPRLLSSEGDVYLGSVNGLLRIASTLPKEHPESPVLELSDVFVGGDRMEYISGRKPVLKIPEQSRTITIKVKAHNKDIFRKPAYCYNLQGYEKEPIYSYLPELTLNTLSAGTYQITASCTTRSGEWTDNYPIIELIILPPWYRTWWFILTCILTALSAVGLSVYSFLRRKENRMKLAMKEHEQQAYEEKIRFLININHELRTPLTLIHAPLKQLIEQFPAKDARYRVLQNIARQSERMKNLLNMVLDVRKMEVSQSTLHIESINLEKWLEEVVEDFIPEATQKHITLTRQLSAGIESFYCDKEKCTTIITNLLINAIKYSNEGGEINIITSLSEKKDRVRISVSDQGPGLKDIDVSKLFTRFYQGENSRPGSGIGLSYSKILAEQQGGSVGALNNVESAGSTFWFELPLNIKPGKLILQPQPYLNELLASAENIESVPDEPTFRSETKDYTILVVDDNMELVDYLTDAMRPYFKDVRTAYNGEEALEMCRQWHPDVIISDIQMPKMNGYELCKRVKEELDISHTPVILLTARNDEASRIFGYKNGADTYLTKPFEISMLYTAIYNQLKNRERIKKKYISSKTAPTPEESTFSAADEKFLNTMNQIITENIDEPNMGVPFLCDKLGMSRASLYNKLKALTGMGANDYINKLRIDNAINLLLNSSLTVNEIADRVGFSTPRYFSAVFKKNMGCSPTQYKEEQFKNNVQNI